MQIIDRRKVALGGQNHTRKRSKITAIAWHYTAVARKNKAFITTHETYWRNHHGWKRGGYHFYIDADGKIYQNYDYETVSNGVGGNNSYIVNICVEANSADDYSQAQIEARDWLTRKVMKDLNIPANRVMGHKEFPGQSTACPGYTKDQMDEFRRILSSGSLPVNTEPEKSDPSKVEPAKPAQTGGNSESIVDYLNKQKIDSSFSNRAKLAKQYGISDYSGTAAQNTQLLNKIKNGTPAASTGNSFKAYSGSSVVDFLNLNKIDSSFNNRKKLADQYGIKNYKGTATQNTALLNALQGKKAVAAKPAKSIEQMAKEVIAGKHGNGHANRQKSLGINNATYQKVRNRVNQLS